ncbi:MAG: hypothetical protein JXM70_03190 [Pirellulales bacterium]|nr:hypothetical protein [Pirellulales bacterium]
MPTPAPGSPVDFVFRSLMLDEDPHPLSVEAFDDAGNRSAQSEELLVTIDLTDPDAANITADMLAPSDSVGPDGGAIGTDDDGITNINQPAFGGIAEANAKVRIFAERVVAGVPSGMPELVGQSFVNSDQSDGETTIDPPNTDVLGIWEITVEPLSDGEYLLYVEVEDLAGNIAMAEEPMAVVVDTLPPQRPTIDLQNADDTGSSDLDDVTIGDPLLLPSTSIADFRISAESGSWVQVKDGEVVIDAFVFDAAFDLTDGVMDGFGLLTIDFIANEGALNIPAEGPHPLSVEAFDVPGNRSAQSEELMVLVDTTAPLAPTAPDLLPDSDTGVFDDDNVTSIMSPAFSGYGEANSQVRIFAENLVTGEVQLVGQGVVNSDESDLTPDDGLGTWEVTIEPLDDGAYQITAELEDLAGNISEMSEALIMEIDSIEPNMAYLDLATASDTGRHDGDEITFDNTPDVTLTTHDPNEDIHLLIPDLINGGVLTDYLIFRIYDRFEESDEFLLYDSSMDATVDSVLQPGDSFTNLTLILETLPEQYAPGGMMPDGVHNLKLEVEDRAGNISHDFLLNLIVDTVEPPVSFGQPSVDDDGLVADSDSDVAPPNTHTIADRITNDTTPMFWGRAEADSIVKIYGDVNGNGTLDIGVDVYLGQDTAIPLDGNDAEPDGYWEIQSVIDLNDPMFFFPMDGLRTIFVTAEDVAGNVNSADGAADVLEIFIDTQGPVIEDVYITHYESYDLFDPKPSEDGPTPLVYQLSIDVSDLPERVAPDFLYEALKPDIAEHPGHYLLVGDANGVIPIQDVEWIPDPDPAEDGYPAYGTIILTFADPLPDDRFTLTVSDALVDPAGNHLDGESNAIEPQEDPLFPTGDGIPGGDFIARFTVDSRPEIGAWAAGSVWIDTNGNFIFDPTNLDYTNQDITYTLAFTSDEVFAGNFASGARATADGFDKLAAYGRVNGSYRWLIDTTNDGVPDLDVIDPKSINGYPVAGNFDGNSTNGDEVGLFTGSTWWLDTNHDFKVDTPITSAIVGYPIVGDFDGDGLDDLATWTDDRFSFDLANNGFGQKDAVIDEGFAVVAGFIGVRERPVAADMDQDGIDDIGLWVPDRAGATPEETAEWYFLISDDHCEMDYVMPDGEQDGEYCEMKRITGQVNTLDHHFTPIPFGNDIYALFGDDYAAPIVGNFDPPVTVAEIELSATDTLELNVTLVKTPTATYASGQVDELPQSEVQIDEWDSFWVEIWADGPESGDVSVALNLGYDAACFTAMDIEYGPAFDQDRTGTIDNASGTVEGLGATVSWNNLDGDRPVLMARVLFEPTDAGAGVPLVVDGNYPQPIDNGIVVTNVQASLSAAVDEMPATTIMPVAYDLDDDGQVSLGDLAFFSSVYGENIAESTNPYAALADFDQDGVVGLGDLAFFASAYQQSQAPVASPPATSQTSAVMPTAAQTDAALATESDFLDTEENAAFIASLYEADANQTDDSDAEENAVDEIMLYYGSDN